MSDLVDRFLMWLAYVFGVGGSSLLDFAGLRPTLAWVLSGRIEDAAVSDGTARAYVESVAEGYRA